MQRRPHHRGTDGRLGFDQLSELLRPEPMQPGPEPDVRCQRHLRLHPDEVLDRVARSQLPAPQQHLAREQRPVQPAGREDVALSHRDRGRWRKRIRSHLLSRTDSLARPGCGGLASPHARLRSAARPWRPSRRRSSSHPKACSSPGWARRSARTGWPTIAKGRLAGSPSSVSALAAVGCLGMATALPFIIGPGSLSRPTSTGQLAIVSPRPAQIFQGDPATVPVSLSLSDATIVPVTTIHVVPNEGHIHLYPGRIDRRHDRVSRRASRSRRERTRCARSSSPPITDRSARR